MAETSRAAAPAAGSAVWMIIALAELAVIVGLLLALAAGRRRKGAHGDLARIKREALEGEVDMDNIVSGAFRANDLYKRLIRTYHPDRYAGDEGKVAVANEIASRITKNKHNYKALLEIEKEAEQRLSGR